MTNALPDISIEHLLEQDIPQMIEYNRNIVMLNNFDNLKLLSHPARLKATTVLICLHGEIDCSINLKRFRITANHLLVNFSSDIIQIHSTSNLTGYAVLLSEDYMQQLQIDFRLRAQSYIGLRGNGPIQVPYDELASLKPYYTLLRKNMEDGNPDVINGLAQALAYSILAMVRRFMAPHVPVENSELSRARQIFDRFMTLLHTYHDSERSIRFYADRMCLTPKYVSKMIKAYSGKCALDWINDYVVLEAKMMLRHTSMSVQEISFKLNFPTQSAFGKYFKQQVGVGPKQYRTRPV